MMENRKIRVLIAEDEALVAEMIAGLSEDIGYTVAGKASDGARTVEMTRELKPDVVLMDIKMPDMDGVEAARRIFETCPTPVVVVTAYETRSLVKQASEAGVGAYLTKPPSARELERAVTIALARFEDMLELRRKNAELEKVLATVKTLRGLIPICASCKKIRDDKGFWHQVEVYVKDHSEADFTHGICPDCLVKLYPKSKTSKKIMERAKKKKPMTTE